MDFFERSIREKVAFVPGQAFFTDGCGKNTLRLNFSNADEPMIEEGMKRLARVFAGMHRAGAVRAELSFLSFDLEANHAHHRVAFHGERVPLKVAVHRFRQELLSKLPGTRSVYGIHVVLTQPMRPLRPFCFMSRRRS